MFFLLILWKSCMVNYLKLKSKIEKGCVCCDISVSSGATNFSSGNKVFQNVLNQFCKNCWENQDYLITFWKCPPPTPSHRPMDNYTQTACTVRVHSCISAGCFCAILIYTPMGVFLAENFQEFIWVFLKNENLDLHEIWTVYFLQFFLKQDLKKIAHLNK